MTLIGEIPALILGAVAVLVPDHGLGLPLTGLTTGTLAAGENHCALHGILYHCVMFLSGGQNLLQASVHTVYVSVVCTLF